MLDNGGLHILHDFTADTNELLRKLAAEKDRARGEQAEEVPNSIFDASIGGLDLMRGGRAESHIGTFFATQRILDTLSAFEEIAQYLSGVPGRKSLIWVSSGFSSMVGSPADMHMYRTGEMRTFGPELDRVFRALNSADVAVYPVDVRGVPFGTASFANTSTMVEFASHTGGRAYYNRNNLDTARLVSASVNYIRRKCGECLVGGTRIRAWAAGSASRHRHRKSL